MTLEHLVMCGQGEWSLDDKYASKKFEERKLYSKTEEQKKRAFEKFYVLTIYHGPAVICIYPLYLSDNNCFLLAL